MLEVVTTIEIAASPAVVWSVLTDFGEYPRWNPVIRRIAGPLAVGGLLSVLFQPKGALPVWFRARVSVAKPQSEFRWTGKLISTRLFSGDHYFIFRPAAAGRVELLHGETFAGLLAPLMYRLLANYNRSGFVEMNQALKAYIETSARRARVAPAAV